MGSITAMTNNTIKASRTSLLRYNFFTSIQKYFMQSSHPFRSAVFRSYNLDETKSSLLIIMGCITHITHKEEKRDIIFELFFRNARSDL